MIAEIAPFPANGAARNPPAAMVTVNRGIKRLRDDPSGPSCRAFNAAKWANSRPKAGGQDTPPRLDSPGTSPYPPAFAFKDRRLGPPDGPFPLVRTPERGGPCPANVNSPARPR